MIKLTIAIAGLAVVTGCSDIRDRDLPVSDAPDRPLEIARAEETRPTADSAAPAPETRVAPTRVAPRKQKQRTASVPDPEPSPAPAAIDRAKPAPDSVTPSQRSVAPDSAPTPEPAPASRQAPSPEPPPAPEPSSEPSGGTDTGAYAPYPNAEPGPDTAGSTAVGTASSTAPDTAIDSTATATPPVPEPDSSSAPYTVSGKTHSADATGTLAVGTVIHAALEDSIHSRHDVSGKVVTGRVMENVTGPDGLTLIAAGSPVQFTVTQVKPGRANRPGVLEMRVDSITIGGRPRKLEAKIQPVSHELRGRGVTGDEAVKVGVGAAGGAVVGRVIGGTTKGAVIGGVVGAAGGAVVASETAARDVVVKARTPVAFVLTAPLATR